MIYLVRIYHIWWKNLYPMLNYMFVYVCVIDVCTIYNIYLVFIVITLILLDVVQSVAINNLISGVF